MSAQTDAIDPKADISGFEWSKCFVGKVVVPSKQSRASGHPTRDNRRAH
jgi:hypothetical protein